MNNFEYNNLLNLIRNKNIDESDLIIFKDKINDLFIYVCENNDQESAQLLYDFSRIYNIGLNLNEKNDYPFRSSCELGHKNLAEWLYNTSKMNGNKKVDIHATYDYAFKLSCKNGHKEIAEWLYNISKIDDNKKIDISRVGEDAFFYACYNGYKEIAEWLYGISKIDNNTKININIENDIIFKKVCENGHQHIAEWLYQISKIDNNTKIDIHTDNEFPFRTACEFGYINLAKWLYNLSKVDNNSEINIHILDDYAFILSCQNNHVELAKWLCDITNSLKSTYKFTIIYSDNKLIPLIQNIKTIFKFSKEDELDKIFENSEFRSTNDDCMICRDNLDKYWVQLDCKHEICSYCFINIDRCPYRCHDIINLHKVIIFKKR